MKTSIRVKLTAGNSDPVNAREREPFVWLLAFSQTMHRHRNLFVEICDDLLEMVLFFVLIDLAMEGYKKNPVKT